MVVPKIKNNQENLWKSLHFCDLEGVRCTFVGGGGEGIARYLSIYMTIIAADIKHIFTMTLAPFKHLSQSPTHTLSGLFKMFQNLS